MTLFYSNVQNKRNSLYSYNPSAVIGSSFGLEQRIQKNENENENKNDNTDRSADRIPNRPHTGMNKAKQHNPLGNTLKTMYENETKRHYVIIKRLDKIENFMLMILIILALIALKLYQK